MSCGLALTIALAMSNPSVALAAEQPIRSGATRERVLTGSADGRRQRDGQRNGGATAGQAVHHASLVPAHGQLAVRAPLDGELQVSLPFPPSIRSRPRPPSR